MAVLFTLLLGAAAILLGYYLYDFSRTNFIRETEAAIDSEIASILASTRDMSFVQRTKYIAQKSAERPNPLYFYQDKDGKRQAGTIETLPQQIERVTEGVLQFNSPIAGEARSMAAKIHTFADGSRLLVARDIHAITESYHQLRWISYLIMGFMLVVVLVSFFISIFVVGRINNIALTARQIVTTGDLSRRISVNTSWDDLSNLAQILNTLLDRIEQLMHGIREVSDNIAHDLRTPLTRLKNRLEEMQERPVAADDITLLLKEADGLLTTFHALLRIANIEKGKRHLAFSEVDINRIIEDVVELYEPLAEARGVALQVKQKPLPSLSGDRNLLFQLFANLLDNAVKFSPVEQPVEISLTQQKGRPVITIADRGIGITEEEKERVFNRFYRSDKSRHKPGSGLGLSLAKAVLELHRATILLENNQPGLRVVVRF